MEGNTSGSTTASSEASPPPKEGDSSSVYYQPAVADLSKYTILQVNGCRSNRALNWTGPEPPTSCELFVKNIPRRFKGEDLWPLFERYGKIYNIRVLMDYNDYNRGFAYVKFSTESQAQCCMELMNHFFVFPGYRLNIRRSTDKNRLFANFVPKDIPIDVVHEKFKEIFPDLRDFFMPSAGGYLGNRSRRNGEDDQEEKRFHRGFAFLEFRSHQEAVAAKKLVYTGVLEIWGAQVKISWARPEGSEPGAVTLADEEEGMVDFYPRLFVKPFQMGSKVKSFLDFLEARIGLHRVVRFDLKQTIGILKVLTVRDGDKIIRLLKGKEYGGHRLHVEWYKERNTDAKRYCFCKSLEMMCTANQWSTPVIIFGRIFPERNEQYAAIFTTFRGHIFTMFARMVLIENMDLTSRITEVFLALIEENGYLPSYNYVVRVEGDEAKVCGFVSPTMSFTRTFKGGTMNHNFYWYEMMELNWAVRKLARIPPRILYEKYQDAIDNSLESEEGHDQYVVEEIETNNRIFCSVFNDQTNMTLLMLCDKVTQSNKYYTEAPPNIYSTFHSPVCYGKHPQTLALSKLNWKQVKKEKERD